MRSERFSPYLSWGKLNPRPVDWYARYDLARVMRGADGTGAVGAPGGLSPKYINASRIMATANAQL